MQILGEQMPTYILSDQEWKHNDSLISKEHFGVNLVTIFDDEFVQKESDLSSNVVKMGIQTLRFPGGSTTERYFDMTSPNATASSSDPNQSLIPMNLFFKEAGEIEADVSVVIPTESGFAVSSFAAMESGEYGRRVALAGDYIENVLDYVSTAISEATKNGIEITAFEIGNEFWGAGKMTATEYGFIASTLSAKIQKHLDDAGLGEIDIVVQSVSSAGEIFSPRDDTTVYIGVDEDGYPAAFTQQDIERDFGGKIPAGWSTVTIPGQGSAREQSQHILDAINGIQGAADAVDGVALHYYTAYGFDGVDTGRSFTFDQLEYFAKGLDRSAQAPEIEFHITEWNTNADNAANNRGLQHASMMIENFYEMVTHGVDHAQIWPLTFDTVQSITLTDPEGDNLTIAGEMFKMMSESLVGLTPEFDWSVSGELDTHGFSDGSKSVVFVSERSGKDSKDITLHSSLLVTSSDAFVTYTELSDGGHGGVDARADPILSYADGKVANTYGFNFDLKAWANLRIEITPVGKGDDVVFGRGGNDLILTKGGDDKIFAGKGNDTINAGRGDDIVFAGKGDDIILSSFGNDILTGGSGSDKFIFRSGSGENVIQDFDLASDKIILNGRVADDYSQMYLNGRLKFNGETVQIDFGNGDSVELRGGSAKKGSELDLATGSVPGGVVIGNAGTDLLIGSASRDKIFGKPGGDYLYDGGGFDFLRGGKGVDYFEITYDKSVDRISDFTLGEDILDITAWGVESKSDLTFSEEVDETGALTGRGLIVFEEEKLILDGIDQATFHSMSKFDLLI